MAKQGLLTFIIFIIYFQGFSQFSTNIPPDKPKLIVGIVVEQMRQDYIDRFWDYYQNDGFKKLASNGTYFKHANLNYSLTQTNPGLATIVTGAEPSGHGIVSDYWYVPITGEKQSSIENQKYKSVWQKSSPASFSPEKMFSTSFSDEAKLHSKNKSKVFSVALNPAAAVISGGFAANSSFWFDKINGGWTSNTYYINELPQWVDEINKRKTIDRFLERIWEPLLDLEKYNVVLSDTSKYEFGVYGMFKSFPYNYKEIRKYVKDYELLTMIPEGNTYTTDFAVATLLNENMGKGEETDFLFINYSVTENIGNLFGPQSVEIMDIYLRLDKDIAHLISVLEETVGKNNFLLYLTSSSGVSEVPQYLIDNKIPGGYFKQHYVKALLESYLRAIYGEGNWILEFGNNQIFLNRTLIEDSQISLAKFQQTVVDFIINSGGIAYAISSSNMKNNVFIDGIPQKMQNSYNAKRSGDIMIALNPGWIEDMTNVVAHNSPYAYDSHVPLLWYGWRVKRQTIYEETNITNIAPTISMILNSPKPPMSTGKSMPFLFLNK